jgi:hypothetical protein
MFSRLSTTSSAFAVGSGDLPATYVGDSDDGFSTGTDVGVYESSSEEAGAIVGFFVGISVVSFPPPSSSDEGGVGEYVGVYDGEFDVMFAAIGDGSDDGRDDGIAVGLILGLFVGVVDGDTVGELVGAADGETVGDPVGADVVGGTVAGLIAGGGVIGPIDVTGKIGLVVAGGVIGTYMIWTTL